MMHGFMNVKGGNICLHSYEIQLHRTVWLLHDLFYDVVSTEDYKATMFGTLVKDEHKKDK